MIECIFTLDYEIYGNSTGSLFEQIYNPAEKLKEIFLDHNVRLANFVEVAELEKIEAKRADSAIDLIKTQIQDFYRNGFGNAYIQWVWYCRCL